MRACWISKNSMPNSRNLSVLLALVARLGRVLYLVSLLCYCLLRSFSKERGHWFAVGTYVSVLACRSSRLGELYLSPSTGSTQSIGKVSDRLRQCVLAFLKMGWRGGRGDT